MYSVLIFTKDIFFILFSHSIKYRLFIEYNIMAVLAGKAGPALLPGIGANAGPVLGSGTGDGEGEGFQRTIAKAFSKNGLDMWAGIGAIILIIAVIVIIYLAVTGGFSNKGASKNKKKNRRSAAYKKKKKTKKNWFLQQMSNIQNSMKNPFGIKAYNGLPRAIENGGRCDNISWLTINNGKTSMCINASFKQPDPIRFTIDPTNLYEYEMLPNTIKNKIRTNTEKLSITIPYKYNEKPSAYVLDFSKAIYEDGTTAKELFNERFNFDYWNFKPKNLNKAPSGYEYRYESKFRPLKTDSKYKGLDSYL